MTVLAAACGTPNKRRALAYKYATTTQKCPAYRLLRRLVGVCVYMFDYCMNFTIFSFFWFGPACFSVDSLAETRQASSRDFATQKDPLGLGE